MKTRLLFIALLFVCVSACKKKEEPEPEPEAPSVVIKNYNVMIHVNLGGTTVGNTITLPNTTLSNSQTLTNIADGFEHRLSGKTGEVITVNGTNTCTSTGYTSITIEVYLNGTLFKVNGNNNPGGHSSASISATLP
jgi:hypothetical protein